MEMNLDPTVRERRPFVYSAEGSVSGDEYPNSVSFYWVQAWHDVEKLNAVNMVLVPEIRWGRIREKTYTPTLERAEQYRDAGRLFDEVKIELTMQRGDYLVIAPNTAAQPPAILGRVLLSEPKGGLAREKVLLVCPRVVSLPNT